LVEFEALERPAVNPPPRVAVLFADPRGIYAKLPECDVWGLERDARLYPGPLPVVAHPPCARWCRLAGLVEARWGIRRGEDDGCFASALESVQRWGGVLEHPAWSDAWAAFSIPAPDRWGWCRCFDGGWVCHVEQGRYGHRAKKATWLYWVGDSEPLPLRWGVIPNKTAAALVSWCGNHLAKGERRPRLGKRERSATPKAFAKTLVELAIRSGPRAVRGAGLTLQKNNSPAEPAPEGRSGGGRVPGNSDGN
jgi:hypothetical protein